MRKVKFFRIAVSAAVFIAVCLAFSGFFPRLAVICKGAFFPALTAGAAAAFFWIVLTLLWGRVFCSWGCPLGFLQDVTGFLGRLIRGKNHLPRKKNPFLRYGAGIVPLLLFCAGLGGLAGWLEPFSVTGRGLNTLFRPLVQWIGNHTHWWHFSEFSPVAAGVVIAAACVIGAVVLPALFRERGFCNSFCPVGFLLGLLSRFAIFRLKIGGRCVRCHACEKVCKAGCINADTGTIDAGRCVACGNCLNACRFSAIEQTRNFRPDFPGGETPDKKRRLLLAGIAFAGGAAVVAGGRKFCVPPEKLPCAPPGAGKISEFNARCTGCQLCIANCPGRVLTPAVLEYGLAGIGQPRMSSKGGFCDYECNRCSNICPSGALTPLTLPEKKRCRVGTVTWYRSRCVVVDDEESCGACAVHCPTGALNMVPWKNGLTIPEVSPELCIGCGGCEYICPVRPEPAVIVSGVREQIRIAPPRIRNTTKTPAPKPSAPKGNASGNDFPF